MPWYVYILRCGDGSLYTGISDDVEKRFAAHASGKGAKYTRGRGPVQLRWYELCEDHAQALRREFQLKRLSRSEKWKIIVENDKNRNTSCGIPVGSV